MASDGGSWEGTISRAAVSAGVAFIFAAVPIYAGIKSSVDQHDREIKVLADDVRQIDRDGPRALDVVKAQVRSLDEKMDQMVELIRTQNDLLSRVTNGRK